MPHGASSGPASSVPAKQIRSSARPPATKGPGDLPPAPEAIPARRFQNKLMAWYREHARDLPWRGIHHPYATWLSEIMLQQTRVATVIDRYGEFLRKFPDLASLAAAPEDDVLALWSGLGYYRRARMLHRGAQFVVRELGGKLPHTSTELRTLPGIGEYTAAAVSSIAFGESIAVVDGNVERVLLRILGLPEDRSAARRALINATAQSLVPAGSKVRKPGKAAASPEDKSSSPPANPPGDHNQAMMELGATICLPRDPLCLQCPVIALCRTRGEHATQPRSQQQSRLTAHLLAVRKRGLATEVLLERRSAEASLMPGMLELPPLPLASVERREPVLRLRHAITNTNYVVQIYSQGAGGSAAEQDPGRTEDAARADLFSDDDAVFVREPSEDDVASLVQTPSLLREIPAAAANLEWVPVPRLRELPLTGLARKCLQRLRVMPIDIRHHR